MFEGLSTALITPFRDDAIDEAALRQLVERQIAAGVDQLVPCGCTGESATLSHLEHGKAIEIAVSDTRFHLAHDRRPSALIFLTMEADLQMASHAQPEVGLNPMTVPRLDNTGVHHGEIL